MMNIYLLLSNLILITGMINMIMYRKQFLLSLLYLEYSVLGIFSLMMILFSMEKSNYILMYSLIIFIIESILGLMILIKMIRYYGTNKMNINSMLW
uniref:NADH dehydrogenase subunit 4L n=1 Tax=Bathynella cf. rufa JHS-2017 TaxID=2029186 RepID=A0A7R6D7H0_9CRUS|nr:NADH dehydrogenase subunit 4L [Bathynella cf. rufa JHS-2017]